MRPMSGRFRLCDRQGVAEREGFEPADGRRGFPEVSARGLSRRRVGGRAGWHGGNCRRLDHRDHSGFLC